MAVNKIPSDLQWADLVRRIKSKAEASDVPTKTSELTNDGENGTSTYVEASELPTVNNATITIQKNGTKVDDFTTNQASNKNINIIVPTTAADVSALPASTKYGAFLELSINSSTYVVTATLKDQDGNTLGTAQTIDLPLESVVVNGSYDSTNKKIVLELESGATVDIPVGDLVAGLQSEITSDNKLSSDLVTDTGHSNKFATSAQLTKLDNMPTITTIGTNLNLSNGTLTATDTTYSDFVGTDGTIDGSAGLVPAPATTDQGKFLNASGDWDSPSFTLPIATASVLGGIKVGDGLSITSAGVLATDAQVEEFTTTEWNNLWS